MCPKGRAGSSPANRTMKNFFFLSNCDYDYEEKFFLEGPDVTEEEFHKLCGSLMEQAGMIALEKSRQSDETYKVVGGSQIMDELVKLLEPHGYKKFRPKEASFSGYYLGNMDSYQYMTEGRDGMKPEAEDPRTIHFHLKGAHKAICEHNQVEYDKVQEARKKK